MKILVINGPNINMLGIREKNIYGAETYEDLKALLEKTFAEKGVEGEIYQSNHEGDLVDRIQQAYFDGTEGIVINPAAYTHTSVAILDALKAVRLPAVEVHISDVAQLVPCSESHFMRWFRQMTGQSFVAFLNEYRLNAAAEALQATDETVLTIASRCGFENLSYFNRAFKAHFGMTPREYRKK